MVAADGPADVAADGPAGRGEIIGADREKSSLNAQQQQPRLAAQTAFSSFPGPILPVFLHPLFLPPPPGPPAPPPFASLPFPKK